MSRSEHATRRDRRDPGDLARKRRIKELALERHRPDELPIDIAIDAIEIVVRDRGPYVHYPASADDLRAILARLPGVANGLGRITLCLDERLDDDDREVDPYVARLPTEFVPGAFVGHVLGQYSRDGSTVILFGYVYDPAHPLRAILEPYLRLKMLATFVHELAHHQDRVMRVARGRWRGDDVTDDEMYAEALEYTWTRDIVVPYLEETAPLAYAELQRWLVRHGGIALPLEVLVGDPRRTNGVDGEKLFFSVASAFESLIEAVMTGGEPPTTAVAFANDLHYGTHYDEAQAVLDRVLADHPGHAGALVLRADILVHLDRLADADAIITPLLDRDPDDTDAWDVAGNIAQHASDWPRALVVGRRLAELITDRTRWLWARGVELAIRAAIELGDRDSVARDLDMLRASSAGRSTVRKIGTLECLVLVRDRRYAEALELATSLRADGYQRIELTAICFEAAYHLHVPCDPGPLDRAIRVLRNQGYVTWADRLEALAAAPPLR